MFHFICDFWFGLRRLWVIIKPTQVRWKKLHPDAKIPVRAYATDGAFDIHSVESFDIAAGGHVNVDCGLAVEVEPGWAYNIRGRSGLTRKGLLAGLGLCDAHFNGSLKVVLSNFSGEPYHVEKGERVAQLQLVPVFEMRWVEVESFKHKPGTRSTAGWGSSGRF
jgi:dUTP pyrophosphatase